MVCGPKRCPQLLPIGFKETWPCVLFGAAMFMLHLGMRGCVVAARMYTSVVHKESGLSLRGAVKSAQEGTSWEGTSWTQILAQAKLAVALEGEDECLSLRVKLRGNYVI